MLLGRIVEDVVRTDGRRVLAGLIRLTGDFDAAEDALQEAYARALVVWHRDGVPATPGAWLNTVARRIAIDRLRRDRHTALPDDLEAPPGPVEEPHAIEDDRLRLLFTCCHPALAPEAQCALALRTLGGLTTREIARAFVEPEATTAQRLVRAKRKIREAAIPYDVPPLSRLPERIDTVLGVLYLIFNEGYAATDDASLLRPDLMAEAIRIRRRRRPPTPTGARSRPCTRRSCARHRRRSWPSTPQWPLAWPTASRTPWRASRMSRPPANWRVITCSLPPKPTSCGGWDAGPRPPTPIARRSSW